MTRGADPGRASAGRLAFSRTARKLTAIQPVRPIGWLRKGLAPMRKASGLHLRWRPPYTCLSRWLHWFNISTAAALLNQADQALYHSKQNGRDVITHHRECNAEAIRAAVHSAR
jgi:hypothetical protein